MTDDALRSVKQVAERLGVGQHSILSLIKSGDLVASDVSLTPGGRPRWRITPDDLEGFLLRRTHRKPTPRKRRRKPQNIVQYF